MSQRFTRVQERIAKRHKFVVSDDDPVMIVATICEAFLEESEKMLESIHEEQLERSIQIIAEREKKTNLYQLVIAALGGVALGILLTLLIT